MSIFEPEEYGPNWLHDRFPPEQVTKRRSQQWRATVRLLLFLLALAASLLPVLIFNLFIVNGNVGNIDPVWVVVGLLPSVLALLFVLLVASAFVNALFGLGSLIKGFAFTTLCLFGRFRPFGYPFAIISQGKVRDKDRHKSVANRELGGPGKLIIHNDSAVVLERYGQITRVEGPGLVFLERFECIREILDLRPQIGFEKASVYTKDGIEIETDITVRYQLKGGPPTPEKPYPVDREVLETAARAEAMKFGGTRPVERFNWQKRVAGNFGSTLRAIVAGMTLDELFEPGDVTKDPRDEISREMVTRLRAQSANVGANVLDVTLGPFKPVSPQIEAQRRQAWRSLQRADRRVEQARSEADTLLAKQTAYAYAQLEMMLAIDRGFQQLVRRNEALPPYFIALRFLETLRQMASSPGLGPFLPLETMRTLDLLNDKLLGLTSFDTSSKS
jgi:regulator of protease activity HflC (stomatin/prohibitin superfamily)